MNIVETYLDTLKPSQLHSALCWYPEAHNFIKDCSNAYGVELERVAAITALYSINQTWKGNKTHVRNYLKGKRKGMPFVVDRCNRIMQGAHMFDVVSDKALKVRSFYLNLLGKSQAVTIDRWMIKPIYGNKRSNPKMYSELAQAIRKCAEIVDLQPSTVQAWIWLSVRN